MTTRSFKEDYIYSKRKIQAILRKVGELGDEFFQNDQLGDYAYNKVLELENFVVDILTEMRERDDR